MCGIVERQVAGQRRKRLGELLDQVILDGVAPEGHELPGIPRGLVWVGRHHSLLLSMFP
jgi:hypothetical protein